MHSFMCFFVCVVVFVSSLFIVVVVCFLSFCSVLVVPDIALDAAWFAFRLSFCLCFHYEYCF